jgi:DNA-binding MarR family transcriptional regulator
MDQDIKSSSDKSTGDVWSAGDAARLGEAIRTSQVAHDMFDDGYARFMGINRTDARCLDIIERRGRITAGQLASDSGLTTGAVTVVIDRLAAAHYVVRERDPEDRRKIWIALTPLARDLGGRLFAHYQLIGPAVLAQFTPDQVKAIADFMEMGTRVNRELAELLEQHVERGAISSEARLLNARAFQRDAGVRMKAMIARLDKDGTLGEPEE